MAEDRAVSIPMTYVMMLGIVAILSAGLFVGMGELVEDQHERSVRSGLSVAGNRLAADLAAADRLARTVDGSGTVRLTVNLPERVAGSTYLVDISGSAADGYELVLTSTKPEVTATVAVETHHTVENGTVDGGRLVVVYDPAASPPLEVRDG